MQTPKIILRLFTLLTASLLMLTISCKSPDPIEPDPTDEVPEFEISGSLEIDGNSYDLSEWEAGPSGYSATEQGFSGSFVNSAGSISLYFTEVAESGLAASHTLTEGTDNNGQMVVMFDGTSYAGFFTSGTFTLENIRLHPSNSPVADIRLYDGSFSFSGTTGTGIAFSGTATFKNATSTFI